jgi:hypothetical protein
MGLIPVRGWDDPNKYCTRSAVLPVAKLEILLELNSVAGTQGDAIDAGFAGGIYHLGHRFYRGLVIGFDNNQKRACRPQFIA